MIKQIPKSDVVQRAFKVYKEWNLSSSSIDIHWGESGSFGNFNGNDENNIKAIVYRSIEAQFYRNPATASILTEVGRRKSYASTNERVLENQFAMLLIPQSFYGEGIKPGSFTFTTGSFTWTDDGFSNLIDSASNIKGNIFYDRGYVVFTKDVISGSSFTDYSFNFRSTKTIYENEIFISVLEHEFNTSTNPTSFLKGSVDYEVIKPILDDPTTGTKYTGSFYNLKSAKVDPRFWEYEASSSADRTGSFLAPFITTIGLYDDKDNMVAVAKLPQPIKSLPDYPVNFIIRFDT